MLPIDRHQKESEHHDDEEEPLMILAVNAGEPVSWKVMEAKVRALPLHLILTAHYVTQRQGNWLHT